MSKNSRRPNRDMIKKQRRERKYAQKQLRQEQEKKGLIPKPHASIANGKSRYETVEEEQEARITTVTLFHQVLKTNLPTLLKRLSKISDPRNPKKIKYRLTVIMIYGILMFVYQMGSRRQSNREMTTPILIENLKILVPEIEDLPHADTLMRLLERIDAQEIEESHLEMVRNLIRKKKFKRYLIDGRYPISIDGTQKFKRSYLWSDECLERSIKKGDGQEKQYYVYVLEASLAFSNGMTIPLMSEFLSYAEGDTEANKQDCEQKAFKRLAARLKTEFKRLPVMILLDGLYPNGPIIEICRKNHWDFMIVLQDKCLPSVWEEYEGLKKLETKNTHRRKWGDRTQFFQWVNGIDYFYDKTKKQILHVIVCEERWQEVDSTGSIVTCSSRHAWVSGNPLERFNLHDRCNLGARHRWNIENQILVEKHQGYVYGHCFSYDWNTMKGYHYLMKIGRTLNVLVQFFEKLIGVIREKGVRGFIKFVLSSISASVLDQTKMRFLLDQKFQLRLV